MKQNDTKISLSAADIRFASSLQKYHFLITANLSSDLFMNGKRRKRLCHPNPCFFFVGGCLLQMGEILCQSDKAISIATEEVHFALEQCTKES